MTKLKNSNCVKKIQIVMKLKLWKNSNCDTTQIVTKLKLWQNSKCEEEKTQNIKRWENSNCDKILGLKLNQNSKNQTVTKLKKSNCDKTQKIQLWQNLKYDKFIIYDKKKLNFFLSLSFRTFCNFDNRYDVLWVAFCALRDVLCCATFV